MTTGGNWIGHAISMASLLVTVFIGAMWVGALDEKVDQLRATAISDGRIAKLEQRVDTLADNTKDLKGSFSELVRELRCNPPP